MFFSLPGATGLNPGAVQVDDPARVFLFFTDTAEQAAQAFYGIALLLQKICPCVNVGHAAARVVEKNDDSEGQETTPAYLHRALACADNAIACLFVGKGLTLGQVRGRASTTS